MKPDWDKLMTEYSDHPSVLIGDVDCTAEESKELCETHGVEGFPTIKHGDPASMESYEGGRDLDALQTFAKESLGPTCGPANMDLCDAEKKKALNELLAMDFDALAAKVGDMEGNLTKVEQEFKEFVEGLQVEYDSGRETMDEEKKKVTETGLALMKQVLASRKKAEL